MCTNTLTHIVCNSSVDEVSDKLHDTAVGVSMVQWGGSYGTLDDVDNDAAAEQSDRTPLDKPGQNNVDIKGHSSMKNLYTCEPRGLTWWQVWTGHPRCQDDSSDHSAVPTAGRSACTEPRGGERKSSSSEFIWWNVVLPVPSLPSVHVAACSDFTCWTGVSNWASAGPLPVTCRAVLACSRPPCRTHPPRCCPGTGSRSVDKPGTHSPSDDTREKKTCFLITSTQDMWVTVTWI